MLARSFARITILSVVFAILGLVVGLVGKYALHLSYFDNPFWAIAAGFIIGAIVGGLVSRSIEGKRKQR